MLDALGKRLYLDANAVIYFIEAHQSFGPPLRKLFEVAKLQKIVMVTSELTLAEILVLPFKLGRSEIVTAHSQFLTDRPEFEVVTIRRDILVEAAKLRAAFANKLPDAIHVATAMVSGCTAFISEDKAVSPPPVLKVVKVSELPEYLAQGTT